VQETTFLETCLPAPVLREATSSGRRLRRPSSQALQWRRVLATLRSFVDNEEDGGENSPRDLLSCSAPGAGNSSSYPTAIFMGAAAASAWSTPYLSFPTSVLLFLDVGRVEYMGRGKNCTASVLISPAPSDAQRTSSGIGTSLCRRSQYVRGSRSLSVCGLDQRGCSTPYPMLEDLVPHCLLI
jgi:hypothetical protein